MQERTLKLYKRCGENSNLLGFILRDRGIFN